ncbi:MAG: DUF2911 domain-containing protein [Planctomycetes bacterium]|nr:DUF2911 domain-containing protein [Planctomycetota bacterium]
MQPTLTLLSLVFLAGAATAQVKAPAVSPAATVTQTIGVTDVTVTYHRPGVKGREIWGKLVPYAEVWRTGANECTTIDFGSDVTIGDKKVSAGKYAFFAIPEKDSWTLILNKNNKQWGNMEYKDSEDVVRFPAKPEAAPMTEWLQYTISPEGKSSGVVSLQWEKIKVSFTFTVDVRASIMKEVAASMANVKDTDARSYYQAASAYFENDIDLAKAGEWAKKAVDIKAGIGNQALYGRILAKNGKKKEGAEWLEKAIKMMEESKTPNAEFLGELKNWLAEAKK